MNRLALGALAALACAGHVVAQDMDPSMPGMTMPPPAADTTAEPGEPKVAPDIPKSPPPPAATDHAADRVYDPATMAAARELLRKEHGAVIFTKVMTNLAEYQGGAGGAYRWDAQASAGGDIDRLVLKSEGDGSRREGLGAAEVQALYSRAVGPFLDVQAGLRQDVSPIARTYLMAGIQDLAPYWFDVSAAVFVSTTGEVLGRLEALYDVRLTQRLIVQPRAELNFAAQDTAQTRTGSGLSNAELGLRLRYEITREFAPYVGVSWDRKVGRTADYARQRGEDIGGTRFVAGIRAWF